MACIAEGGAHEVARIIAVNPLTASRWLYVLCSDGRVLSRSAGGTAQGGFTVMASRVRVRKGSERTFLAGLAARHRLEVSE